MSRSSRAAFSGRFIATGNIRNCGSTGLHRCFQNLSRTGNAASAVRGGKGMNMDHHEVFRCMIDESLAAAISAEKEQSLREHLATCVPCQEYLSASNRAIAGLSGFSFEVNPNLNDRVMVALK